MNSLLQALFMSRLFRAGVYAWKPATVAPGAAADDESSSRRAAADEVCSQLQRCFAHLQHSASSCFDPTPLSEALSLDVGVQQDAQEFNKLLLTFVEEQLKLSPDPAVRELVPRRFRGEFAYQTRCCRYETTD